MSGIKDEILEYLRQHRQELKEEYGVVKIGLFGSVARGEETDQSDVDIAVEMKSEYKTLRNFMGLKYRLEEAFDRPVDLGIESTIKPAVRDQVLKEMIYV
jgi:predicted nucleotidyltransferase